jgi:hypothetical protein
MDNAEINRSKSNSTACDDFESVASHLECTFCCSFHLPRASPLVNQVEWSDINAALGQAALLLCVVVDKAGFRFRNYRVNPMGSFSKMVKVRRREA